jgi:DNA-binding CsgD family transcriptional regulator
MLRRIGPRQQERLSRTIHSRELAELAADPNSRAEYLKMEQSWLRLADSYQCSERLDLFVAIRNAPERGREDSFLPPRQILSQFERFGLTLRGPSRLCQFSRAHQYSIVRRKGNWEFLETPELNQAQAGNQEAERRAGNPSKPFPGHDTLTPRKRIALAQITRGASSKEAARTLGISPRTVDFHRANPLKKLGAWNAADLVHKVLGE